MPESRTPTAAGFHALHPLYPKEHLRPGGGPLNRPSVLNIICPRAGYCHEFGSNSILTTATVHYPTRALVPPAPGAHLEALVRILGRADWVVLCLPLTAETRGGPVTAPWCTSQAEGADLAADCLLESRRRPITARATGSPRNSCGTAWPATATPSARAKFLPTYTRPLPGSGTNS